MNLIFAIALFIHPAAAKISNGIAVDASEYPQVISFTASNLDHTRKCTGFFVAENAFLTSAHCTENMKPTDLKIHQHLDFEADRIKFIPGYNDHLLADPQYIKAPNRAGIDWSLVRTKQKVKTFLKISTTPAKPNDTITMIGFGPDIQLSEKTQILDVLIQTMTDDYYRKRKGFNTIKEVASHAFSFDYPYEQDRLLFGTIEIPNGENAGTLEGDSGGPVLNSNGEVVGIISRGLIIPPYTRYFTDISDPENYTDIQLFLNLWKE